MNTRIAKGILVGMAIVLAMMVIVKFGNLMYVGGTILSISEARIVSNDPELNYEDGFLINLVVNRGGEYLVGEIKPEDIQKFGIKELPAGPFKIYLNLKNVSCDYQIIADRRDWTNAPSTDVVFYEIYQATVRHDLPCDRCHPRVDALVWPCPYRYINLDTVKAACRGQWGAASRRWTANHIPHCPEYCGDKSWCPTGMDNPRIGSTLPFNINNCDRIIEIQKSTTSPQSGADPGEWCYPSEPEIRSYGYNAWCRGQCDKVHWRVMHIAGLPWYYGYKIDTVAVPKFTVEVILENAEGENVSAIITDKDLVANLGDVGRVKFAGSLIAQQFCPQPAIDKAIVKDIQTGKMKVVYRTDYEDYVNTFDSLVKLSNEGFAHRGSDPRTSVDVLQGYIERLNNKISNMYYTNITDNCYIVDNNIYKCIPEKDVIYPQLQLLVKASWIGVYIPSGKPEILSVNVREAYANEVGRVEVRFKNVGNLTDSFDVKLECNKVIDLGVQRVEVSPGEETTVFLSYVGDVGDYDCKVKVQSVNNPNNYAYSDSFGIKVEERPEKEINIPTCENVPPQPCARAIWQGYPVCKWNTQFCEEGREINIKKLIIVAVLVIVSIGMIILFSALIKKLIRK